MSLLSILSNHLLSSELDLFRFILSAPHRYKKYTIPKRNGNGVRDIAQPSKGLKLLQKKAISSLDCLIDLPIHKSAMAYLKGVNIKDNAEAHKNSSYLLKMDFLNFFPSILPDDLIQHVEKYKKIQLSLDDKKILSSLFYYKKYRNSPLILSIGAPTSPYISNTLMYDFDTAVCTYCEGKQIIYTRYADDLVFSTNTKDLLFELPAIINGFVEKLSYPHLAINDNKTVFLSKSNNRHITGLVISNSGTTGIGRSKKRQIKSMVYKFLHNDLSDEEILYLRGYLSFCKGVDEDFLIALQNKYGEDNIQNIKNFVSS